MDSLDNILCYAKKPSSILLIEGRFSNIDVFIKKYLKSILCDDQKFCNKCNSCKEINNNSYIDLISYDGEISPIKKDDVLNIQNIFYKGGIDKSGNKFFILKNADLSSLEASNSLLKFLENPPEKTYGILTSKNIDKIIPTIKSRCQIYRLTGSKNDFFQSLKQFELSEEQLSLVSQIYFDKNAFKKDFESGIFNESYRFITELFSRCNDLKNIKKSSTFFKAREYSQIRLILNIALYLVKKDQIKIISLINYLKLYPSKILVFNDLLSIARGEYE